MIEIQGVPHRKIPVSAILHNPHRDFKANPVSPERVEELLDSFSRTGFWDNVVVREHPTREGYYELAYGHNRLAALKSNKVSVETITVPVAKLSDWDMYCAMVDENEMQGRLTPALVLENINVGCDLLERALKAVGKEGTEEQFFKALGSRVVAAATTRKNDHGFEQVRNAFFAGEGLGRIFVGAFLPCGKLREQSITEVLNSRYGKQRAAAKAKQAEREAKEAEEEEARAEEEEARATTPAEKKKAAAKKEKAKKKKQQAKEHAAEAKRIGRGVIADAVLLLFDSPRTMTDFAAAVRRVRIPAEKHEAAAKHIIKAKVKEDRIETELNVWWDEVSGAAANRRKQSEAERHWERIRKQAKSRDFASFLVKLGEDYKNLDQRTKIAIDHMQYATEFERKIIERKFVPVQTRINSLIECSQEPAEMRDITPAKKMLP